MHVSLISRSGILFTSLNVCCSEMNGHKDLIQSCTWKGDGSLLATTSKVCTVLIDQSGLDMNIK